MFRLGSLVVPAFLNCPFTVFASSSLLLDDLVSLTSFLLLVALLLKAPFGDFCRRPFQAGFVV